MSKNRKILVLGASGMVGSALGRALFKKREPNVVLTNRRELDLTNREQTLRYVKAVKPDLVFIAAAKVGGIVANERYPVNFLDDNLRIQSNVMRACFEANVKTLLFLGSSCIYPRISKQPIGENELLNGRLERTNEAYAIAKISGLKLCESYNLQYGTDFRAVMPTNLYGPGDNYHPDNSHVIPALIRKLIIAARDKQKFVEIWGSGNPRREFLHVDDLADCCLYLTGLSADDFRLGSNPDFNYVNVGWGKDITIRELAEMIAQLLGYQGELVFNKAFPDGTPRKLLDIGRLRELGWQPRIQLRKGIELTINHLKLTGLPWEVGANDRS